MDKNTQEKRMVKKRKTKNVDSLSQSNIKNPEGNTVNSLKTQQLIKQKWSFDDYDSLISKISIILAFIFPIFFIIGMLSSIMKSIQ